MHGLINRSLQCFLRDTYGIALWQKLAEGLAIGADGFETMLDYDDSVTEQMLAAAAAELDRPVEALLEDLGAYLASLEPLRRLLRFGGVSYGDFLQSLDELPGRVGLAVPELRLPPLQVLPQRDGRVVLQIGPASRGAGSSALAALVPPLLAGLLRAMADDYGALALIELCGGCEALDDESPPWGIGGQCGAGAPCRLAKGRGAGHAARIVVDLLETAYAAGRRFDLAAPRAGA